MINPDISKPNFVLLHQNEGKGPIHHVTICQSSLEILDDYILSKIPEGWSVSDFYTLLDEGKRYFGN